MKIYKLKFEDRPLLILIITSFLLNFIIETLSRDGILECMNYLSKSPLVFIYNSFIIFFTLSFMFWFKRRLFMYTAISLIWLIFGITNGFLLSKRVTPFTAIDLSLIKSGIAVMPSYMSPLQITLIFVGITLVIGFILFLWFLAPKTNTRINYKKNFMGTFLITLFLILFTNVGIETNVLADYFSNIAFAYKDYGFPYCFSNTLLNTGIREPENYSKESIDTLVKTYNLDDYTDNNLTLLNSKLDISKVDNAKPNVIMLQLESFFDITSVKGLTFSQDPIPYFRALKENFSHGYLSVPTIGAGTANTEFEVLTGMSLDYFGAGEYPYKTILQDTTSESIAYNLKDLGYSTHAIHDNIGIFYDRNLIFSHLGFDTFTSSEYMNITETTPTGWAKDNVLIGEILKCLDSSKSNDLVYTISVQSHGEYPTESLLTNPLIAVEGAETEELKNSLTYYVNQLYEVDKFISNLIAEINKRNEKTVLVLFGDHLPTLGFEDSDLKDSNVFQTQYLIWDNFNLPKTNVDLQAYQLSSAVLEKLNINTGVLTRYHQLAKASYDYEDNLKMLQYDMLYGEQYIFGETNPFVATNIKMGLVDTIIETIYQENGQVYVKGKNFIENSSVFINDKHQDTIFVNSTTLLVPDTSLDATDIITTKQLAKDHTIYSVSNEYLFQ